MVEALVEIYYAWQNSPLILPKVVTIAPIAIWIFCLVYIIVANITKKGSKGTS